MRLTSYFDYREWPRGAADVVPGFAFVSFRRLSAAFGNFRENSLCVLELGKACRVNSDHDFEFVFTKLYEIFLRIFRFV